MKKYVVCYLLPSGHWSTFATNSKKKALKVAKRLKLSNGNRHAVYKFKKEV